MSHGNQFYTDGNMGYSVNGTASTTDGQNLDTVNMYQQGYVPAQQMYVSQDMNHNIPNYSQDMNQDPFKPQYEYDPASQGHQTLIYNNTDSGLGYETNGIVYNDDVSMNYYHDGSTTQFNHSQSNPLETSPNFTKKTPGPKKSLPPGSVDKSFVCETCLKPLGSMQSLKKHMITHTGIRQFKCDLCGNSYTQKHNLTKHLRVHSGERPYVCTFCPAAYRTSHLLKNHMNKHSENHSPSAELDEKSNSSEPIDPDVSQNDTSETDTSIHGSEKNNSVDEMDDSDTHIEKEPHRSADKTNNQSKLDREPVSGNSNAEDQESENQSGESDKLKLECDQCDQTFESRIKLMRHKNEHSGKKTLCCNFCSASFRWKASLDIHMRRHKGKKQPSYELKGLKIKHGNMISLKIVNSEKKNVDDVNNAAEKDKTNVVGTAAVMHSEDSSISKMNTGQPVIPQPEAPRKRGRPRKYFPDMVQPTAKPGPALAAVNNEASLKPTTHPRKFACDKCGQMFTQNYSLKRHKSNQICTRE